MKEDVLEQVVEDYLQSRGYFTRHNVRFKPAPDHAAPPANTVRALRRSASCPPNSAATVAATLCAA